MLRENLTKKKLRAGEPVVGIRMDFASPYVLEAIGETGFDFVYFDWEHSSLSEQACEDMIRAAELVGMTPLVRVPSHEASVILRYLDAGAMGVIVPHCSSKDRAQAALKAIKYPPQGDRGIAGRSLSLSGLSVADYIKRANRETLVVVMIEDPEGVQNVTEIANVDGVDVLFIGRLDLSVSLNIPGEVEHALIKEAVAKVITQGRDAGRAVGVGAIDIGRPESIREFMKLGAQFFSLNLLGILTNASRGLLRKIKEG